MQVDLASASEAEKSAVLAITDQDSQTFADQARAASGKVEQERREVGELLTAGGTQGERELLAQVTAAFAEFQHVDNDLLALAVKNTNIKAYSLAFGPAATALKDMNAALARLVAANADSSEAKAMMPLAFGAQISALRIQTLLPPHIAEESDKKMDELEALMATEDTQVRKSLDGLAALPRFSKDPELATATARYAEFSNTRTQILALSRENTNVRSLSISLNQKRKVMLVCQAALSALQQAILAEPKDTGGRCGDRDLLDGLARKRCERRAGPLSRDSDDRDVRHDRVGALVPRSTPAAGKFRRSLWSSASGELASSRASVRGWSMPGPRGRISQESPQGGTEQRRIKAT
jgi:hypothetical protein